MITSVLPRFFMNQSVHQFYVTYITGSKCITTYTSPTPISIFWTVTQILKSWSVI